MWDRLNPQQGVYNFTDIDRWIRDMRNQKKFVVFRIRTVIDETSLPTVPAWAKALGVTQSMGTEPFGGRSGVEIDYHKCTFLSLWADFVQAVVQRYDNEPTVVAVDIGTYGWYGEWFSGKSVPQRSPSSQVHDPNDPTMQQSVDTRTRLIRMFTGGSGAARCIDNNGAEQLVSYSYAGFKNKPVIISRGDVEDVQIGVANGAGIRFDGIGSNDSHQPQFRLTTGPIVAQMWRSKPILGEFGTGNYAPLDSGFMMRSLCFAREFHLSGIHNNFVTKPTIDLNPLFRELGYRIALQQATYPSTASAGSQMQMNLLWDNSGTAPTYQRYPLKLYFKPAGTDNVVAQVALPSTDITQILPPEVTTTSADFLTCPRATPSVYQSTEVVTVPDLPSGNYDLYFGFVEPVYGSQIQLALQSKDTAGRYRLGQIAVQGTQPTVHDAVGIYRPTIPQFALRNQLSTGPADSTVTFGGSTTLPVAGDWNGDGVDTVGVYNTSNGLFSLKDSNAPGAPISYTAVLGIPGDVPIVGDWDGDGKDGIGVFRPSNGLIYLRQTPSSGIADFKMVLGMPGDMPLTGRWDSTMTHDGIGVYRPSSNMFFLSRQICNCGVVGDYQFAFGQSGDVPMAGDWNGDWLTGIGIFRPATGQFLLRNAPGAGAPDFTFTFGQSGDRPVAGHWGSSPNIAQQPATAATPNLAPTFVPIQKTTGNR
jgi:Domain of unknown function (DUF4832)